MLTLTYGFEKPQTGDKGSVFFPALEADLQQLNDHTHNGINSAMLTAGSIVAITQAIDHTNWVATAGGTYKQNLTMSSSLTFDNYNIQFRNASTGHILYLTCVKTSATAYDVYINDNTIDLTAVYS